MPAGIPAALPSHVRGLLVPVGAVDRAFLEFLAVVLPESCGAPFDILPRPLNADDAYDPLRRQWNAARLLEDLDRLEEGRKAWRVLGVADVDLFINILTFVFGLAHLGARAALVSVYRLRAEFYGLPADEDLFLSRLEKEAVHEIGHTLGLVHCRSFPCVMHFSNLVEEVDLKGAGFCPECRARIRKGR